MITLKTLSWNNCFSYGESNELDLSEAKLTQILGSNGVGKSSIPLILEEVLFNKNSKGIKKADIPNRDLGKGYSISLSFDKDGTPYNIILDRKSSLKVKFLKDGEDISSHTATNTYKSIQDVLGIDFKTFSQIVYQNTNASLNFLTATDANRKKFLIDLLGLEKYVELFEVFKNASREIEQEYARIEGQTTTIEKWLNNNFLEDTNPKVIKNIPKISEEDQEEASAISVELKNILSTNKKISENNQYKKLLEEIDIVKINNIKAEYSSYDQEQEELGSVRAEATFLTKEINRLEELGNTCITCGQDIPQELNTTLISEYSDTKINLETKIDNLLSQIEEKRETNKQARIKEEKLKEWQELYRIVDKGMPSDLLDAEELEYRLKILKQKIEEQKQEISLIQKENEQSSAFNAKINVIMEQTEEMKRNLEVLSKEFKEQGKNRSNMEILKKAFSTNGLIAYKIENLVKELEELTSIYLAELSDGRFTLNFAINNDKLNVEITDNGNIVDILALSSGELARVNTATLLAIRKLMSSLSSSKINVLFLDEVMTVLDEVGKEKLVEVLLEEDLNTYLVNHGWSHPLLEKIEVVKSGNISRLA